MLLVFRYPYLTHSLAQSYLAWRRAVCTRWSPSIHHFLVPSAPLRAQKCTGLKMAPLATFRVDLSTVGYGPKALVPSATLSLSDGLFHAFDMCKVCVFPASAQLRRLEISFTQKNFRYYAPSVPILLPPLPGSSSLSTLTSCPHPVSPLSHSNLDTKPGFFLLVPYFPSSLPVCRHCVS